MDKSTDEITGKLEQAFPSEPDSPSTGPPVASQKGKLYVKISEGRGLRPGYDPYVVCVFEWNECISKSAKDEEEESMERQKQEQERSDREAGRPMAIPMKSRQSSHNSSMDSHDPRSRAPVTDPHWNHEATLYVFSAFSSIDDILTTLVVMFSVISPKSTCRCTIATTKRLSWVTYGYAST
jgi:protein-serine/threonine kinase